MVVLILVLVIVVLLAAVVVVVVVVVHIAWCTTFLQITLTVTLVMKGGKKGAIINVMPLNQQAPSSI